MQNQPLNEYGDLQSVHHVDKQREESPSIVDEVPRLVVVDGPGNLYGIEWTTGKAPIPGGCKGSWNHKGKAQEAIDGAVHEIKAQLDAVAASEMIAEKEAKARADALAEIAENNEEHARVQKQVNKEKAALSAANAERNAARKSASKK